MGVYELQILGLLLRFLLSFLFGLFLGRLLDLLLGHEHRPRHQQSRDKRDKGMRVEFGV